MLKTSTHKTINELIKKELLTFPEEDQLNALIKLILDIAGELEFRSQTVIFLLSGIVATIALLTDENDQLKIRKELLKEIEIGLDCTKAIRFKIN